uniref:SH2 domain containing 7 n=1 Tax=Amphiprion percula TaxID=161767 RepID=A0A3P8RL91_AMPPE
MSPSSSAASPGHILFTCSAPRMDTSSGGLKDLGSGGLKDLGSGGLKDLGPGGLKDLVLRWFTETQAPNILQNGNLPDWFQGLAARKDAEDLLRDKAVGCFLIRLSDKAVGYILSYRGHDRCRHFVITQNQDGQFVVAGDSETFFSLEQLIQHYRVSPIQPFGEYLTCSCHHVRAPRCSLKTRQSSCFIYEQSCRPTQVEIRSRSLPRLDHMQEEEEDEEYSNRLGSFSPKRVTCLTFSLHSAPRPRPEQSSADLEKCNPLYQASEGPGGGPGEGMYADVPQRTTRPPDDTYEMIPGEAAVVHGNTYESLEDLKTKKSKSTWGKNVRTAGVSEVSKSINYIFNGVSCFLFAEHELEEIPPGLQEEINCGVPQGSVLGLPLLFSFSYKQHKTCLLDVFYVTF